MKIVWCSDLHRGSGPKVDNFGFEAEEAFIELCRKVLLDYDLMVCGGDKEELWQGPGWTENNRLKRIHKRYWKSEKAMAELKAEGKYIGVPGNHDWSLKVKYNMQSLITMKIDGWHIGFMHGHIFDEVFNSKWGALVGRVGTEFWGLVEKAIGINKTSKVLLKMENWLDRLSMKGKKSAAKMDSADYYFEQSVVYAVQMGLDAIFIGHDHTPSVRSKEGIVFGDSGTWIDGSRDYLYINTAKKYVRKRIWA